MGSFDFDYALTYCPPAVRNTSVELQFEPHPRFVVLRVAGDLRLSNKPNSEDSLLQALQSQAGRDLARLVLNLAGVTQIDAMGIRALVGVLIECMRQGTHLKVVLPSGLSGEALRRVRVFDAWPKFADEAEAVQAAQAESSGVT